MLSALQLFDKNPVTINKLVSCNKINEVLVLSVHYSTCINFYKPKKNSYCNKHKLSMKTDLVYLVSVKYTVSTFVI